MELGSNEIVVRDEGAVWEVWGYSKAQVKRATDFTKQSKKLGGDYTAITLTPAVDILVAVVDKETMIMRYGPTILEGLTFVDIEDLRLAITSVLREFL